jgi:hypothetical protein
VEPDDPDANFYEYFGCGSPVLLWRLDYFTVWPDVKNLVPHHSIYSWGRLQEVWRDK